jgi:hypothetical protein
MLKMLITLVLLFYSLVGFAQKNNANWVFGDSSGIDFSDTLNPITFRSEMVGRGSCTTYSDSAGQLILYAFNRSGQGDHSTRIYNGSHQIIQGGDTVVGEGLYNEMQLVPMPGSDHLFYLFIATSVYPNNQGFYYCIIDKDLNGGNGAVIQKNVQLLNTHISDAVQAVQHGNGRDWWVICKHVNLTSPTSFNRYYIFLVTSSGIHTGSYDTRF